MIFLLMKKKTGGIMIKHTFLFAVINLCLYTHVLCSDSVDFSKKDIETRRLEVENDMYQKAISKDMGYYQTLLDVREDKVFETRTFNTGYVLMGGVLIRPVIQVECLYESMNINGFIERIDHIIKPLTIDESKPVSEYLTTLNLIIEELHSIGISGSSIKEIKDAAIILANWNRDPVEVLKEARERQAQEANAGKSIEN